MTDSEPERDLKAWLDGQRASGAPDRLRERVAAITQIQSASRRDRLAAAIGLPRGRGGTTRGLGVVIVVGVGLAALIGSAALVGGRPDPTAVAVVSPSPQSPSASPDITPAEATPCMVPTAAPTNTNSAQVSPPPCPSVRPTQQEVSAIVPPEEMSFVISNGTTIILAVVVNGEDVGTVRDGHQREFGAAVLPPLPWAVEVGSATGRVLVSLAVHAGDVASVKRGDKLTEYRGVGARVDLSCGRIDVYSGPPILGPMPIPGTPGDCD